MASDGAGNVYVLEEAGSRVQKFSSAGVFQRMWGKDVDSTGPPRDGLRDLHGRGRSASRASKARLVASLATRGHRRRPVRARLRRRPGNHASRVHVPGTSSAHRPRRRLHQAGPAPRSAPSPPTARPAPHRRQTGGTIFSPLAVAIDPSDGAIYIANGLRRVDKFTTTGGVVAFDRALGPDVDTGGGTGFEVCTVATSCKVGIVGTGLGGEINLPVGVAVAAGSVYVFSGAGFRVDKFTTAGGWVSAWARTSCPAGGTGFEVCTVATDCKTGVSGSAAGEFRSPNDLVAPASDAIAVDPEGQRRSTSPIARTTAFRSSAATAHFEAVWGLNVDTDPNHFSLVGQICSVAKQLHGGDRRAAASRRRNVQPDGRRGRRDRPDLRSRPGGGPGPALRRRGAGRAGRDSDQSRCPIPPTTTARS